MFTEAIIIENINVNTCKIRVPIFETVGQGEKVILTGKVCMPPGALCTFNTNDKVWITFENNEVNKPIIVGQLYTAAETAEAEKKIKTDIVDPAIKSITASVDTKISSAIATAANRAVESLKTELAKNVNEISCGTINVSSGGELPGSVVIKSTTKTGNYGQFSTTANLNTSAQLKEETTLKEVVDTINKLVYALYGKDGIPSGSVRCLSNDALSSATGIIQTVLGAEWALNRLTKGNGSISKWKDHWYKS